MDNGASSAPSGPLARFACDYCRQKKFRCSRELPKCSACKPWPSSCDYSRDNSREKPRLIPGPGQVNVPRAANVENTPNIEQRLHNIERAVQQLTESVGQVLEAVASKKGPGNTFPDVSIDKAAENHAEKDDQVPDLFVGPSHSFSFLKDTPARIDAVSRTSTPLMHQGARSELQFLSTSLTTATVNTKIVDEEARFYTPSKAMGYQLIGRFLEHAAAGEPFFSTPSDDLLKQIIFDPESVTQKAWVVYVNYIMLARVSADEHDLNNEAEKFRRNMRLALNDSRIFLEPREANVQALTLLALHGEDYASPNLSWMLVGHACRQAEALGLHAPTITDFESRQRSLCIFWLLFMVDKSCALAFGRSSFLPVSLYRDVPLPEFGYLLKFQPHTDSSFSNGQTQSRPSPFGAYLLMKGMEVSKLMGWVLDLLTPGPSVVPREEVRLQLENWYQQTNKILNEIMESEKNSVGTAQLREMSLGLSSMKFQYLHAVILLHKGDASCAGIRLESAREALSLLPSMVSNWSSVYNGVVWHLLYYPFIPFFVVFDDIVHNHTSQASTITNQDIDLLSTTVSYFASMRAQLRLLATVCTRLEQVASVFLQLAQNHAGQRPSPIDKAHGPAGSSYPLYAPGQVLGNQTMENTTSGQDGADALEQAGGSLAADIELDISTLLDWLPADTYASSRYGEVKEHIETAPSDPTTNFVAPPSQGSLRGRKRTFDATFDWFSWDAYYADTNPSLRVR